MRVPLRIEFEGLVHNMKGYNERRAVFEFYCGRAYEGAGHEDYETLEPTNCMGCAVWEPV